MNRTMRWLAFLLALCLSFTMPAAAEDALWTRVSDRAFDITSLVDWLDFFQGNMLQSAVRYSPEQVILEVSQRVGYGYLRLYSTFVPGLSYILKLDNTQTIKGVANRITVRLYDFNAKKTIVQGFLASDHGAPQAWIFTVPEGADVSNVGLLIYAGEAGKTWDNTIRFDGLGLYMWMPGIRETALIEAMQPVELSELPDEAVLLVRLSNPYTDTSPLLKAYAERNGAGLLAASGSFDPARFVLQAGENASYQYQRLYDNLVPGESYLLSIAAEHLQGDAQGLTLRVYDFVNSETLQEMQLKANQKYPQLLIFTVPEEGVQDDAYLSLMLYAGEAGQTGGNTFVFTDACLYAWEGIDRDAQLIAGLGQRDHHAPGEASETASGMLQVAAEERIEVAAASQDGYASACVYNGLVAGGTYTLTIGRVEVLQGNVEDVTVRVFSPSQEGTILRRTVSVAEDAYEWTFVMPRDVAVNDVGLYLYAGVVGKTQGNAVAFNEVTLRQENVK